MPLMTKKAISADGVSHDLLLSDGSPSEQSPSEQPSSERPQPESATSNQPLIFCLPAMGVPARKYAGFAEQLEQQGFAVALFEWRGIDSSSVRASRQNNFGYAHLLNYDLPAALAVLSETYPDRPIYLCGHSLGGQLGLLLMCQYPKQIKGMIGIATGTPYFRGWRFPQNIGLLFGSQLMRWIASIVGHFPGRTLKFAGRESRQVIKDWSRTVISGQYQIEGVETSFEQLSQELRSVALMITIDDDMLAPPQSAKNLGAKLKQSRVDYQHLVATDFESRKTGHFNWMKDSGPIAQRIANWLATVD